MSVKKRKVRPEANWDKLSEVVESTIELVEVFTVSSTRSEKDTEKWRAEYEREKKLVKERNERYFQNAEGRPIVRHNVGGRMCYYLGPVVRETAKFYIYAVDGHLTSEPNESLPTARVWKDNSHTECCRQCTDHPNSNYAADGWCGQ